MSMKETARLQTRACSAEPAENNRVTASISRTEDGEIFTEYTVDGETYHDVKAVEAELWGESAWD